MHNPAWPLTLYFDGDCPLCAREIRMLSRHAAPERLLLVDISAEDFDPLHLRAGQRPYGIDDDAVDPPTERQRARLQRLWWPMLGALVAGTLAATGAALLLGALLGASPATLASLAPKSVTTPVAMGIAERIGGLPSLTAVLVVSTGIIGAVCARPLFDAMRIQDPVVRGFALGTAAHGIGTARAFQVSPTMGAFSGLAMGLAALFSAVVLPALAAFLLRGL